MTAPVPPRSLFGAVRLEIMQPDTTPYGTPKYLSGINARGSHSARFDSSSLTFDGNVLESVLAADETILEDAFVVAQVAYASGWQSIGTPYMLAPGSGTVIGPDGKKARVQSPVATGALNGLLDECIAFPHEPDPDHATFRRGGGLERNVYYNFGHKGYDEALHTWHDGDEYDPTGHPKEDKPDGWPVVLAAAVPVFRDADEGGRTCFRPPTFTLTEDQRVVFCWVSDENGKLGLSGPNQGGIVVDWDADEDGWQQGFGHKTLRLKAGTYRPWGHMLSINSDGGDGNDSARFGAYSIKTDGTGDVDEVLFVSDSGTRVLRQPITDQLPGMSPGETMRRALQVCADLGSEAAQMLLDNRTFTDALDTAEADWTTFVEWVWPWGTSLASAFADLLAEIDLDMGTSFTFDAWQDRGADLTADVDVVPGTNLMGYGYESDKPGPNAFLTESQEGSGLYEGTVPTGQRRRFGSLESGASGTVARANRNARQAVKANGEARRYYRADVVAMTDAVPWVDFTIGDLIHGRGYRNLGLDVEVTGMSWEQGAATVVSLDLAEPVT